MAKLKNAYFFIVVLIVLSIALSGCSKPEETAQTEQPAEPVQSEQPAEPVQSEQPAETPEEDTYPSKPIEFVIGWGPGGGTDVFARTINIPVRKSMEVPLIETNMSGANSAKAADYVQAQPADGYTIFAISGELLSNPYQDTSEWTYEDFIPITRGHVDVTGLHVKPGSYNSWEEMLENAKNNPGKQNWAGMGNDTFRWQVLTESTGIEVNFVPFNSAGEMHAALLGGHIDAMFEEYSIAMPFINDNKVEPVLTLINERLEMFPEVPCLKDYSYKEPPMAWRGVAVKKGTPPEIVEFLEQSYLEALDSSVYKDYASARLLDIYEGKLGSEDFMKALEKEDKVFEALFK